MSIPKTYECVECNCTKEGDNLRLPPGWKASYRRTKGSCFVCKSCIRNRQWDRWERNNRGGTHSVRGGGGRLVQE